MDTLKLTKYCSRDLKRKTPLEDESFNFPSLPYVCQRRFVEICDGKTLKKFTGINAWTRKLSRRCLVIDKVVIYTSDISCNYTAICYCNPNEICHHIINAGKLSYLKNKVEVANKIKICGHSHTKTMEMSERFLQSLPFSFNSVEQLELKDFCADIKVLKKLIIPGLKKFWFFGGIGSNSSLKELKEFVDRLSKLKKFVFAVNRFDCCFSFDFKTLLREKYSSECQKIIESSSNMIVIHNVMQGSSFMEI